MYVKLENNIPIKWPVSESEVRDSAPNSSLPEYLSPEILNNLGYGIFVYNGYPVEYDPELQNIEEIAPVLKDGKYQQSYKITEKYTPSEKQKFLEEKIKNYNKMIASSLLQETDWTATIDINKAEYSNPYLMNQSDFLNYRSQVRAIAVNPPDTTIETWPTKPDAIWSN